MKTRIVALVSLLFILCALLSACGGSGVEKDLAGVWRAEPKNSILEFKFDNGTVYNRITIVILGQSSDPGDFKEIGTYTIGESTIDIVYSDGSGGTKFDYSYQDGKLTIKSSYGSQTPLTYTKIS